MDGKSLPTEIGLEIFYALDSLEDVLSLSATTRWLRGVWITNMDVIYRRITPVHLEGKKYAQALQRSISGQPEVTVRGWVKMCQRAKYVNSIVDQFEDVVVKRFNFMGHPDCLTRTERRRFIRTYYQLWYLIRMDKNQWSTAISTFSMKNIFLLREMCFIPLAIGEDLPGPRIQEEFTSAKAERRRRPCYYRYQNEGVRGELGSFLFSIAEEHLERVGYDDPWMIRKETRFEGYGGFHVLWDYHKSWLRQYCTDRYRHDVSVPAEELEYEWRHLWAESSDEEKEDENTSTS